MQHHRWELSPMGSIPHQVLAILLGSLPKVPDSKQEEEALGRQYTTHDDRLSDDGDDDDETSRSTHDITNEPIKGHKGSGDDSDAQRAWNVPDDEWEWSDEEPASSSTHTKASRTTVAAARSRHGNTLVVPSKGPTGLGLSTSRSDQHDSTGSRSSNTSSRSSSAGASGTKRTSVPITSAAKPMESKTVSHPLSVAQDLSISICDSGHYMACASKKMFAILQRQPSPVASRSPTPNQPQERGSSYSNQEWVLIGQGSGLDSSLDAITTVLCLPLYVPRSNRSQVYVVLGYKSGMIRIFNEIGQLVVVQQLHHTPVVSIKARIGAGRVPGSDEDEMTILHEGGKVVCIEGESLWVVLRLSNGSSRVADANSVQATQTTTFAYQKWSLQNQDLMVDVVSCGPARHKPTLSNGFSSSSSSSMYTSQATERFLSVGSKPMMAFYASSSASRPLFSATSLATQMAVRVTSAVFGFAKSIWGSSPRPGSPAFGGANGRTSPDSKRLSGQGIQEGTAGPYGTIYPSAMAPATEVPAVLWLSDSQRCIRHVSLAPPPPRGTCYHSPSKLAAMTDSLGRVLLVDLEECEIIRMWKGLRGARCGWLQEERIVKVGRGMGDSGDTAGPTKRHLVLYLVIYAPKRGTVEIYPARQGKRAGLLQIGLGWKVCTTFTTPIGKPAVLDRIKGAPSGSGARDSSGAVPSIPASQYDLAQCFLVGPTGEVKRVGSRSAESSASNTASTSVQNSLTVSPVIPSSSVKTGSFASKAEEMGSS
ncbi:Rab3 GTPase-activating protein non-catalytic subunit [Mortierella hygrophila]|uniref:Rab3 GTPase-activating protein non-catalytic subunit n=1 Tax=Mortierella hygrophila TaxID=979708 RepID=A0A9P6K5G3_9FUNG|nr:Rab3 GTPase-activating protein non-catalytic subunit [Mortierella hygrophila]